jgi:NCS1 family nucleobase:cation symporter-1
LLGLLSLAGVPTNALWMIASILSIAALVVVLSVYGHATLVWVQPILTVGFGILTLVVVVFLIPQTQWSLVLHPAASWVSVLAAFSIIFAATGVSWVNNAADYSRYLPEKSAPVAIVSCTILGATIPVGVLILVGFLLSSRVNIAAAANPIQAIGSALPSWMVVPYLLTAVGGNIAGASLTLYSSGLNLLTMGLRVERYKSVLIDGALIITGSLYVMLVANTFLGPFESFLQLLAAGLTAWSAVFLVDMLLRRRYDAQGLIDTSRHSRYYSRGGFNLAGCIAWLVGLIVGLAFTASPLFTGPFAVGIFGHSSLGYFLGTVVSAVLYSVLMWFAA